MNNEIYGANSQPNTKKTNWAPIIITLIICVTVIMVVGIVCVFLFLKGSLNLPGLSFNFVPDKTYTEVIGSAEITTDGINGIEIEWVSDDVKIEYYDGDKIYFEETSNNKKYPAGYKIKDGALEIKEYAGDYHAGIKNYPSNSLILKLPKDFQCFEFCVEVVSANVTAQNLNTTYFELETVSGNAELAFAVAPGKIETESVSGDIKLALPNDVTGYTVSKESVSGSVIAPDFDNALRFGDGSLVISMESVSGNLTLSKAGTTKA